LAGCIESCLVADELSKPQLKGICVLNYHDIYWNHLQMDAELALWGLTQPPIVKQVVNTFASIAKRVVYVQSPAAVPSSHTPADIAALNFKEGLSFHLDSDGDMPKDEITVATGIACRLSKLHMVVFRGADGSSGASPIVARRFLSALELASPPGSAPSSSRDSSPNRVVGTVDIKAAASSLGELNWGEHDKRDEGLPTIKRINIEVVGDLPEGMSVEAFECALVETMLSLKSLNGCKTVEANVKDQTAAFYEDLKAQCDDEQSCLSRADLPSSVKAIYLPQSWRNYFTLRVGESYYFESDWR